MIRSKTYQGMAGLNYIEASELALTRVYKVARDGIQHDKNFAGSTTGRTYIHDTSNGRVYFPISFGPSGERVFVKYKETSGVIIPIPGVCNAVVIPATTLPNGIIGVPYSVSIALSGSSPFTLDNIVKPAWATVALSFNIVNITGTPTTETIETISFDVSNCDGANTESFSESFDVLPVSDVIGITNNSAFGVFITSVTGIPWTLYTGSFPLGYPSSIGGVHSSYTGVISVSITGIVFTYVLKLYKNGSLLQGLLVSSDDTYDFASQTILSSDEIQITLE